MRYFEVVREGLRKHKEVDIQLPQRGTKHSMGYDLFSPVDEIIKPGKAKLIFTDVKVKFNPGEALIMNVRSSMGLKGVMMANSQGWIECDYYNNPQNDGNLGVMLYNFGEEDFVIKIGDRIGQVMFVNHLVADNGNVETERKGGYGSTGK